LKGKVVAVVVAFTLGGVMGNATAGEEVVTETRTDYVPAPIPEEEPEVVTEVPESCLLALEEADQVWRGVETVDSSSSKLLDLMSQVRISVASENLGTLNRAESQIRDLQSSTSALMADLSEAAFLYQQQVAECRAELN
jgi:hypothetical protein